MTRRIYAVEITTGTGTMISRYFTRIVAARRWARYCAKSFPTRIVLDGKGGAEVK